MDNPRSEQLAPDAPAAAADSSVLAPITLVFEHPLHPAQRLVVDRARALMLVHHFELHNFAPSGETIEHIRVADHIQRIEFGYSAAQPDALMVRFTVGSKEDRDALVWTSSLFFQYVHYHVARIATVNGVAHHMDWEAQQDPQGPERVKLWVESGHSLIERLHKKPS